MYWLTRPPYWRWLAAACVVAVAAYMDLSGPPTELYPFVAHGAESGETVVVEWRPVPSGFLPPPGETTGVAGRALVAGTPLVPGLLRSALSPPADWWAVPTDLPALAAAGSEVLISTQAPNLQVSGIVVAPSAETGFGSSSAGLVAIPLDQAAAVAAALAEGRATILVRP